MQINKGKLIHIVGIGGIGMSGIAEILNDLGYLVQGSDIAINTNITRLKKKKIKVFIGHKKENIQDAELVVYSSAIKKSNSELKESKTRNIPIISRAEALSQIANLKKTIAISGSHGKTTTTSLIATVLNSANYNPTVINGGIINQFGTNTKLGNGEWMVIEADESDGTFVKLPSTISVVTNIDHEHLDYYKSFSNLKSHFKNFLTQVPFYGFAVVCIDDEVTRKLVNSVTSTKLIKYGFHKSSDVSASNIHYLKDKVRFDVYFKQTKKLIRDISLPLFGDYNIRNSLAAIAICSNLNVPDKIIKQSLSKYKGVERRLTKLWSSKKITIIDDYAHHPTEIENVLRGLKKSYKKTKMVCIFQPHRFSRMVNLKTQFTKCFKSANHVFVSDVYRAGEKKPKNFKMSSFTKRLSENSKVKVSHYSSNNDLLNLIDYKYHILFVFLGAGTVTSWAKQFSETLKKIDE